MKRHLKLVPVLFLLVFGAAVSGSAEAQRGGHGGGYGHSGGYGHGYGWGGGPRWGVSIGLPLYWPGYYGGYYPYSYAYPAPAYTYPAPPGAYVEQGGPQAEPAQPLGDWYYCASSNAYFPYVRDCPGGWQPVPSTPPR